MSGVNRSYVDVNRLGAPVTKSMIEVVPASSFDRVTAERDALQQRLTAADERADRLETGLKWESDRNVLLLASLTEAEDMLSVTSLEAGQRIEVLEGLLRLLAELPGVRTSGLWERVVNALKPADGRNSPTCTWSHDGIGIWAGSCGTKWAFTDDGPTENGMRFCHSCGKALVVESAQSA